MKVPKKEPLLEVIVLILVVLLAVGMARGRWDPPPEIPSRDVVGPLQLELETEKGAPLGHSPSDRWRTHHREAIARGDFPESECQVCHDPKRYCNQCHGYVGVKRIESTSESEIE